MSSDSSTFLDRVKKAGKSLVDSGAKTMLKTDVVFLEREIKQRKQQFGVEVYELMEALEVDRDTPVEEKESKIRAAFDSARKDIAISQAKIECKREEMSVLEAEAAAAAKAEAAGTSNIPPSSGTVLQQGHPDDSTASEMEHSN
mmetsp:Transcript_26469/g.37322  ORF Transcript_26469/g.37322 Transcript_26469/m.37322 type:complete len:144 (+) Transcript_26469:281-712(+)